MGTAITQTAAVAEGYVALGVACVIRQVDRILLIQRAAGEGAGSWGLPGGRVEPGEMPGEAAIRELAEETGLRGMFARFIGCSSTVSEGRGWVTMFFAPDWWGEPVNAEPDRHSAVEWFALDAMPDKLFEPLADLIRRDPSALYR